MAEFHLDFEKPLVELKNKIHELQKFSETSKIDVSLEIAALQKKIEETRKDNTELLNNFYRKAVYELSNNN